MDNKEIRVLQSNDVELRVDEKEPNKIFGYAAKFDSASRDLGGFVEYIDKNAFKEALKNPDTVAVKNHDSNLILGRTKNGTLRMSTDSIGLKFEVDMPNTTIGKDTLEEVRRGDIDGCSFAFTVTEDSWRYCDDDTVERTILQVGELIDVSAVLHPAYPDTSVAVRSLDAFKDHVDLEKKSLKNGHESTLSVETEPETEEEVRSTEIVETDEEAKERQRLVEIGYRRAGRIINRCRTANAESANGSRV